MGQRRWIAAVLVAAVAATACGTTAADARQSIKDKLDGITVDSVLEDLRDCDALSDKFVDVVGSAADALDELSEAAEGRVPATEIREVVDNVASNKLFEIAEKIGCNKLQSKLDVLDQLNGVNPSSPAGNDFLDEIMREIEASV